MTIDSPHVLAIWAEAHDPRRRARIMGDSLTNSLPWEHNRADLAHFRELTMGRVLVMGRKTFESLPQSMKTTSALEARPMVVITSHAELFQRLAISHSLGLNIWPVDMSHTRNLRPGEFFPRKSQVAWLKLFSSWFGNRDIAVIGGPAIIELFADAVDTFSVTSIEGAFSGDILAPNTHIIPKVQPLIERLDDSTTTFTYTRSNS